MARNPPASGRTANRLLWTLSLCMLLSALSTSVANVALPTLARTFGAAFQQVQWVVLAYLLGVTTLIVSVGRLGDITGRRRLLLIGLAVFAAASIACGLAPSLPLMIAARAGQGLGAAVMMALSVALAGEAAPKGRTGAAMGLLGTMSAVGTALGPSVGGVLIATLGWRAIFLVCAGLGVLAFGLVRRVLPADRPAPKAGRAGFDLIGTLLLALTLAAYALAMTVGRGRFGPPNAALLAAALCGLGAFLVVETKAVSPLIRPAMFRDPVVGPGLAANLLVSTVMMATLVVGPFYLARALALGPALVGGVMSLGPLAAALTGAPAGRAVDRFGARRMSVLGLAAMATGALVLATLPLSFGVAGYIAAMVVVTAGYALFQAANTTAVMTGAGPDQRGAVSGMLGLSRNLGLITGASVMGAVFALGAGGGDIAAAGPDAVAGGMRITFAAAASLACLAIAVVVGRRARTGPFTSAA